MRRQSRWIAGIALLLLTSCSYTFGIVKKTPEPQEAPKKKIEIAEKVEREEPIAEDGVFHIVGKGESLRHICSVYGLNQAIVAKINNLEPPFRLAEGDTVFLSAQAMLDDDELSKLRVASRPAKSERKRATRKISKKKRGASLLACHRNCKVPELRFPVPGGELSSPFGHRWGLFHKGLDIAAPVGKAVLACEKGRVIFTGTRKRYRSYGNTVLLDHGGGVYTHYAHLSKIMVRKGALVKKGQRIGLVGNTGRSTGPHLHLEVRVQNKLYNPLPHFAKKELAQIRIAKRFMDSPMGPVRARWRIPSIYTAKR